MIGLVLQPVATRGTDEVDHQRRVKVDRGACGYWQEIVRRRKPEGAFQ